MSGGVIDFHFACVSPWSYLGCEAIAQVAAKHGRTVAYRPVDHARAWAETGAGRPLPDRPAVLQAYRLTELPRWAAFRDVPLNLHPKHFPTSPLISGRTIVAAGLAGLETGALSLALMRGCWVDELDIGDPDTVARIADGVGLDGKALVADTGSDAVEAAFQANTDALIAAGGWSVPTFVVDGEPFFGQDRIELIDWRLSQG